eukprot:m.252256 g.252256  ORF g.252256 m.252256 type:complete len:60 (+) comp15470_c3_seq1:2321-2500(+)
MSWKQPICSTTTCTYSLLIRAGALAIYNLLSTASPRQFGCKDVIVTFALPHCFRLQYRI